MNSELNSQSFLPDLSKDAVFRPCSREPFEFKGYLAGLEICMEKRDYAAWWAINFCHLSYCKKDSIKKKLPENCRLVEIIEERTQLAYCVEAGGYHFVIFQGSCAPEDTLLDLDFFPKKDESLSMHRGFHKAFNYLWPELQNLIDKIDPEKLILCGHSLGGALAYILSTKVKYHSLYTFGAPRVVFNAGNTECKNIYRYVNCSDAVPTLPPAVFGFKHIGQLIFIDDNQIIHEEPGFNSIFTRISSSGKFFAKGKWIMKGNAPTRSLVDHAPVNYSRALSRHLLQEQLEN